MKFLVVGGGSGGHITPAVAVVREILEQSPRSKVEFWTDKKYYKNVVKITTELGVRWGSRAGSSARAVPYIRVRKISAGKFRRYSGWSLLQWIRNWWIVIKDLIFGNIVGFFQFIVGLWQSFWRLLPRSKRPDVIFLKGGFVGLPVGLVAKHFRIPYVIHESDAVPGLANRILMKHATVIATGWKEQFKSSGSSQQKPIQDQPVCESNIAQIDDIVNELSMKAHCCGHRLGKSGVNSDFRSSPTQFNREDGGPVRIFTGIPVAAEFRSVSRTQQNALKKSFGFDPERPLVVVTGGSQGAENINEAMRQILPEMLEVASVGLVAGRKHYENMVELKRYEDWNRAKLQSNFRLWEFNSAMHELLGAADIVISRAGATTIAELAALEKAVILVPFEALPNSHQLRNAEDLARTGAVVMIKDSVMREDPKSLLLETQHLIRAPKERANLAEKLHQEAAPDAATRLAMILLQIAKQSEGGEAAKPKQKARHAAKNATKSNLRPTRQQKRLRKVEKRKTHTREID